ncbi:MAG: endolytic transglycosylase MltG, partial [Rickettsiales bacterium]|nr:endolytic transglycosylase MltG [Rickettsiales bacterium]
DERGRVASVFMNRLRLGMKLQSDPTVVYGMEQAMGRELGRPLFSEDLRTPTPYNTYVIAGLPPGPIANPGRESLAAVLNPPDTKDLYFVATGKGGHFFAATLDEHNRNVAQYRRAVRAQD